MIPSAFGYERATSVDDALARLAASGGAGKLIAGGHSLVPLMKLRLNEPGTLIDIARIPELSGIREVDGAIEVGAGTVHHAVATSDLLRARCPVVAETGRHRDAGAQPRTLGGSIAHADPAADYPATLLALDAEIRVQGPRGARTVAARDFFQDLFTVDLAGDELITAVRFAPVRAAAYAKLYQRASRFAIVGVAAALDVAGGVVRGVRLGLTGALSHAVRLTAVETPRGASGSRGRRARRRRSERHHADTTPADYRRPWGGVRATRAKPAVAR